MDKDFIKDLVENKDKYASLKKATIKLCDGSVTGVINNIIENKSFNKSANDTGIINKIIIGNTYNWMDSHSDVHKAGVFAKSIKERKSNIFHLVDHEYKLTARIGEPNDIYEKNIRWKDLGVDKAGETEALFLDSSIYKSYNERIFNDYSNNKIQQHSVGMQYTKLALAVNDEEYEEEYKLWKSVIDSVGNKDVAIDKGFFWYVSEAKLIEISAVLLGSNELTPTLPAAQEKVKLGVDSEKMKAIKAFLAIK